MTDPILSVRDLTATFGQGASALRAVNEVSFDVMPGEVLGLVGESGCGKSTTARAILHLIDASGGEVRLGGQDLLQTLRGPDRKAELAMRRRVQYVFQDPYL